MKICLNNYQKNQFTSRTQYYYENFIVPDLLKQGLYKNINEIPKIECLHVHMGLKESVLNEKNLGIGMFILSQLTSQKANPTFSKQSIAQFKLRQGMPLGVKTTLRGKNIYFFLDRFISHILPNIKDFSGLINCVITKEGNLSLGFPDVFVFPEIENHYDNIAPLLKNKSDSSTTYGFQLIFKINSKDNLETNQILSSFLMPLNKSWF